jgi:hypothetical protein
MAHASPVNACEFYSFGVIKIFIQIDSLSNHMTVISTHESRGPFIHCDLSGMDALRTRGDGC